jgi:hypothetical protein
MWEEFLDNMDEKPTNSFLYSVVMDPYSYLSFDNKQSYGMSLNQKAFMATYETIKSIAEREFLCHYRQMFGITYFENLITSSAYLYMLLWISESIR